MLTLHKHVFEAIGTKWSIETTEPLDAEVKKKIHSRIETFDKTYSRFRSDSIVGKITKHAGSFEFPEDSEPLFDLYDKLFDATSGAVTPLIGQTLEAMGYDAAYSLKPDAKIPKPKDWKTAVKRSGRIITTTEPLTIDVGAAGKGYLTDIIGELLNNLGLKEWVIDASGDILHHTSVPDVVALVNPADSSQAVGFATLQCRSLCSSSASVRRWGDNHHIVNGVDAQPARDIVATWVCADNGLLADGLATALFFTPPERLNQFNFDWAVMRKSGTVHYNKSGMWEFFTQ